jgi:adenosylmethionine---8-amino-7-oxononanoate aminotransferase
MLDLLDWDRDHLWHPYTSLTAPTPTRLVTGASGARLQIDGRDTLDAMSSWWATIHGYRHPVLDEAVRRQLDDFSHVMFGGLTHEPAIRLGQTLVELTGLPHVFFADSGSVSVEVAMKMAMQARPGRTRFLTVRGGYHGDTFDAMSVCDPDGGMHTLWAGVLPQQVFGRCSGPSRPRSVNRSTSGPRRCAPSPPSTPRRSPDSSSSRSSRAPVACTPIPPRA